MSKLQFVKLNETAKLPLKGSELSSGLDFYANNFKKYFDAEPIDETSCVIQPNGRVLVGTGLAVNLPYMTEMQIRPRSGLALKHGISVVNTPGTIDEDYKDEIGIILINTSNVPYHLNLGERIAQGVVMKVERFTPIFVENLEGQDRGGGFGHTGKD